LFGGLLHDLIQILQYEGKKELIMNKQIKIIILALVAVTSLVFG